MPNPFYGAYEAGAVAAHAEPVYLPATAETGFLPDLDSLPDALLARTVAFYLASPANPQGSVASPDYFKRLAELARRHGFIVFSDECYSEIYTQAPPPSMLEHAGRDFENVVVFQSLSKRSNLPGLRVGFAAGDRKFLARFLELRNVSSPQVPVPAQRVAIAAYNDEKHVDESRVLYAQKFDLADQILGNRYGYQAAGRRLPALARRLRPWRRRGGDAAAVEGSGPARDPRQLSRARAGGRLQSRRGLYPRRHRAGPRHHGGGAAPPGRGARLRTSHVGDRPQPRQSELLRQPARGCCAGACASSPGLR